uniref:hypothetical protein n=1 Tax=Deinococcus sp. TaxID=47478 RepID=UPI0028698F82
MQLKALTLTLMAASALVACSAPVAVPTPQASADTNVLTSQVDKNVLDRTFRDTWRSMAAMTAGQRLPSDNLCLSGGSEALSAYTSPTNIGAYLWSTLAARDHGVISASDAHARMAAILTTLSGMERHHG